MEEYKNLKKAYDRLEKLYTIRQMRYTSLLRKYKLAVKEKEELDELVEAHIRLNKELTQKLKKTELELAKASKPSGNPIKINADKQKTVS